MSLFKHRRASRSAAITFLPQVNLLRNEQAVKLCISPRQRHVLTLLPISSIFDNSLGSALGICIMHISPSLIIFRRHCPFPMAAHSLGQQVPNYAKKPQQKSSSSHETLLFHPNHCESMSHQPTKYLTEESLFGFQESFVSNFRNSEY